MGDIDIDEKITELSMIIIAGTGSEEEIEEAIDQLAQNICYTGENEAFITIPESKMKLIFKKATTFNDESIIKIANNLKKRYFKSTIVDLIQSLNATTKRKEKILKSVFNKEMSESLLFKFLIISALFILMFLVYSPKRDYE